MNIMTTNLTFRRAEPDETARAQAAYRAIIDHLAETTDFPHWHTENHPTADEVFDWVRSGHLFLAVTEVDTDADTDAATDADPAQAGAVAGVVVLDQNAVDSYAAARWSVDAAPQEVLVVHALGVVPAFLGTGVARFLLDASLRIARDQGCRTVRLDTYVENRPARRLYTRCGFTDLGLHTVRYEGTDLSDFHLFEYVL